MGRTRENFGSQSSLELCDSASNVAGESRVEVCNEKQEHVPNRHSSVKEEYNSIYGGSNPWEVAKCQALFWHDWCCDWK
jgi:hypothetical protein